MRTAIGLIALFVTARAHMSPFLDAMYGGPKDYPGLQNPVMPLGPELEFDDWWFRGPDVRNAPPKSGAVAILPAGGDYTLEIACAPEYTTYDGNEGTGNVACDEPGPYHADPAALKVDPALFSGCAIGISDVMDPNDATMDDFTIISVQSECISDRDTTFSIPARMPSCTGEWCICGWVWLPQTGDANAYHTPFRCKISDSPADARPIASPQDPVFCPDSRDDCTKGAKKMISTYNYPVNVPFTSYADRPGYHGTFGFFNGPQDDIFLAPSPSPSPSTSTISTKTTAETSNCLDSCTNYHSSTSFFSFRYGDDIFYYPLTSTCPARSNDDDDETSIHLNSLSATSLCFSTFPSTHHHDRNLFAL
ncbi:uncharacterized protein JCM6883_002043 [Sporobolomyces salmoneus]|uniref:uncharacterized protein n=1 Tax=Sporobolomyces salmoneus TaxID=183962 RepID=UPI00317073F0